MDFTGNQANLDTSNSEVLFGAGLDMSHLIPVIERAVPKLEKLDPELGATTVAQEVEQPAQEPKVESTSTDLEVARQQVSGAVADGPFRATNDQFTLVA